MGIQPRSIYQILMTVKSEHKIIKIKEIEYVIPLSPVSGML